jgi:hypothetical protein
MGHQIVRCPPPDSLVPTQEGKRPIDDFATIVQELSGVHRTIQWELPNETPTAPRPLEAIKEPLCAMEQYTKHPKSTLQL